MMTLKSPASNAAIAALVAMVLALALFRVLRAVLLPDFPNFFPVVAMAFCGGLFLPRTLGWILPSAVIVLSDLALSFYLGYPLLDSGQLVAWACLLISLGVGHSIADRKAIKVSILFVILTGNALIFYLATNTMAWVSMPAYSRDAWGLIQALTTGLPGNPPTWVFFRNSLISDYIFFGVILLVFQIVCRSSPRPVTA